MSDSEQNKTVVRACFACASQGDLDALHDILDDDYVIHPEEAAGVDGLTELVEGYRSAIGGLTVTMTSSSARATTSLPATRSPAPMPAS